MDNARYYIEWNDGTPTLCRMPHDVYGLDDDQGFTFMEACRKLSEYHTDKYLEYGKAIIDYSNTSVVPDYIRIKQG
jgi:hypothetical protein